MTKKKIIRDTDKNNFLNLNCTTMQQTQTNLIYFFFNNLLIKMCKFNEIITDFYYISFTICRFKSCEIFM